MDWLEFLCHLLTAIALGGLIGLERQLTGHAAGIRTCVLVCVGASLFTAFPFLLPDSEPSRMDITRVAAQIVSGVGFLGSGIIFQSGPNVRGLNTAATIWCTAGVGIFAGAGLYFPSVISAFCLFSVNLLLRAVMEQTGLLGRFDDSGRIYRLCLTVSLNDASNVRNKVTTLLRGKKLYLIQLQSWNTAAGKVRLEARYIYDDRDYVRKNEELVRELSILPGVRETGLEAVD